MKDCILAMDQGTTSSRAIVFDLEGRVVSVFQQEFPQIYPADGWVEHDPEAIWETSLKTAQDAFREAEQQGYHVAGIGITNQRETTIVWDRQTGKPVYNAIVWQDRRTAPECLRLKKAGAEETVRAKTGLLLDPYFSATKIAWILDNVEHVRPRAEAGELAFGTVDSFLINRLTGGQGYFTDATNASRTSLFSIKNQDWDAELLDLFNVPAALLPKVLDSADSYGETSSDIFGRPVPICGVAGDQQAAVVGQCCFKEGDIKSTYGTGCFVMLNTGDEIVHSAHQLLTTVAYRLDGKPTYCLEGSIFVAGAAVQWLRDGISVVDHAKETETLAQSLPSNEGVYLVPAFTGLGAPYWDPDARASILGMTRDTGRAHLVRAALEAVCYQTADLFAAMASDGVKPKALKVDGGMVANDWFVQFLSDLIEVSVDRPVVMETTALGVAFLAALQLGFYSSLDDITNTWAVDKSFIPNGGLPVEALMAKWHKAVEATRLFSS